MSESGIQITIPDLTDDNFNLTANPFSRAPGGAFGFGSFAHGQESPTASTPTATIPERGDRQYFHSRGDSATSDDSIQSLRPMRKASIPFVHSSQSSAATNGISPFSKKPSFASIRNAFKGGIKTNDQPPLPPLDYASLPFNRSNSSLGHASQTLRRGPENLSPPHPRPPTPGSSEGKYSNRTTRSKGHASGRSGHSHSSSVFHNSDTGSDHGHGYNFPSSPPPLPPMPNGFFSGFPQSESPTLLESEEDKVEVDPRTPAEYALHAVFMRFATAAEHKIGMFLKQPLDQEQPLPDLLGPGIDPKFDDILQALGRIGQKNAKPVVDSIRRWRQSQNSSAIPPDVFRLQLGQSPASSSRGNRSYDASSILSERKSLAAIYIMCRALIVVMQSLSKDALGESIGFNLEETTFEQFRRPDLKLLSQSANHRTNAELYATLLGYLANSRFISVTDRFLAELAPVASGQVAKDVDLRYENLVRGLKHIQIKVWPPESFEEGAEFMEALAKAFENAHGFRFKLSFAEALVQLLHPVAKTAQAEVNHPQWAKAIEIIHPKARDLSGKLRYWHVAYALVVVSLCVSPIDYFLRNWAACFEAGLNKLKEKAFRIPVMNGMMRLIWTYMFRCRESLSATTSKMESLLRNFFPPNRLTIFPHEDHLEPFIYIVHFLCSRNFDFGAEFVLNLMQEQAVLAQPPSITAVLSPERLTIAVRAVLLTFHLTERDEPIPAWPSSSDFSASPSWQDYPSSSDFMPLTLLSKPGAQEFFDRFCAILWHVASMSMKVVSNMSVFDEQWTVHRQNPTYEETHSYIIRRHPDGAFAYPSALSPPIHLLQTCFHSWPRCLHKPVSVESAIDMLLRGVIHIEPSVGEAAVLALRRFMADSTDASVVLKQYTALLFDSTHISQEGSAQRLVLENARFLNLWANLFDGWMHELLEQKPEAIPKEQIALISARLDELEAGALFLLCYSTRPIYTIGVKLLRLLHRLTIHLSSVFKMGTETPRPRIIETLYNQVQVNMVLESFNHVLEPEDVKRAKLWRDSTEDALLVVAESEDIRDRTLWQWVFPGIMQTLMVENSERQPNSIWLLRESLIAAASRFHPTIAVMAGLVPKMPPTSQPRVAVTEREGSKFFGENKFLPDQWYMWTKVLSSIAAVVENRPALVERSHSRVPSDASFDRERLTTTRGLIRYLTPFLDSEHSLFRDAAVFCISSFPAAGYSQLLEDLGLLLHRQFLDDSRIGDLRQKAVQTFPPERGRRQERLYTAVARIYFLTAHYLQDQRSPVRQAALSPVLRFVRNTQSFLATPESRDNFKLQRLRRYFCGTVERLFDGLSSLSDTDRFIPAKMHLSLYRLCEEWCQLGHQSEIVKQRLIYTQRSATEAVSTPSERGEAVTLFQKETKLLSKAAAAAMASLCARAYFQPDMSSGSPTEGLPEYTKTLSPKETLDRIHSVLTSMDESIIASGRRALKSLLTHNHAQDDLLTGEALQLAFVTARELETSNTRFFEVVADLICQSPNHGFRFEEAICLGLSNLCHSLHAVRRRALQLLEAVHERTSGMLSLTQFEATVGSSSPSTYLRAHRLISDVLAGEHPDDAMRVLSAFAKWLPRIFSISTCPLTLLQSLEYWSPNINLMADKANLSHEGRMTLLNLISLTLRYADSFPEQIEVLWTRLVDAPYQSNGHATVRFLLEQSQKVGSVAYIRCATKVVACLSHSVIGRSAVKDLCSVIEPARMLPSIEHKLAFPEQSDIELWSELDALFSEQPRQSLGAGQFALLFLSDVALERSWEFQEQLPTLLHAIFTHLDHRLPFVRESAKRMLIQLLRSWIPGYDELPDRLSYPSRSLLAFSITELEQELDNALWREDESSTQVEPKMHRLCSRILTLLVPLHPKLAESWGSLALFLPFLQVFRALLPGITSSDLALLLARLSNTISAPEENIRSFSSELIRTLKVLGTCDFLDTSLLPQMFWCTCACLSTTVELEFLQTISFLESVLSNLDLDDEDIINTLISQRPAEWMGTSSLQLPLLIGLRSSVTSDVTFKMLQTLAKVTDSRIIDPTRGRVRDLYTVALPWCYRSMTEDTTDPALQTFAQDVGYLADQEGRSSISRIMASFIKGRFRTKEDFLRQSVASLREHYGVEDWTEVVTLLLGLVLNSQKWLRVSALQILKVLFQQRETRNPVELLGSELLMPLLRLLETDLAPAALEVLDEPMTISGGPPAKQVLRMSMQMKSLIKDVEPVTEVFGIPEESGWCVARPERSQEICRSNIMAVFETCKVPSRPSQIYFEPEDVERHPSPAPSEDDLSGLVRNLHELSSFFQGENSASGQQLEARVAAILAKSTELSNDIPQTPFIDVFRVDSATAFERDGSEDESDYSSDSDAFVYDSPVALRAMRSTNGLRQ
ncbi:cell morphogenesis N-terminal-domain-containing protein [Multifurca ochricompacta]|uniref:Cell morphogenesis N-terminal-domain-containing protein n=1 Tax=Multifurca ochricompacta TaxID=376703 RepID=A0AAD4QQK5_9AGAM|nr:cell morphogenesis N-terminal-domain-containing protein [Multifurca ochricompacta]